ncbi:peptidase s41 family [Fusarium longipes]|uniref:Peptidase s41 family n=1 Tax=Fusarium longipes TaxID=694270 RepID=A0A395RJS8_9HYPO|nr:peptidase s41 family [Fusarium longipes]
MIIPLLALAAVGFALDPRQIMHARDQPLITPRDLPRADTEPCKFLSGVYRRAGSQGEAVDLPTLPSFGIACLKSVPLDKKRDLELLDYLEPLVEFQSTLEILANPPEEYLFPGVDVLGGFDIIRSKLENDKYKTQYEVMTDLRSLFAAAYDGHFDYPPALLNAFGYSRPGIDFISVSSDGVKLPFIFSRIDSDRGNQGRLDYNPSAVKSIDGTPIEEWLEEDASRTTGGAQDPDAQYNGLFATVPQEAVGSSPGTLFTLFEIPDNYTIEFYNGTKNVVENVISVLAGIDLSGIESGEDFHQQIEVTPTNKTSKPQNKRRSTQETERIPGYPEPIVKHSKNSIAGYFLDGKGYEDTAVLSILSFLPVGLDISNPPDDFNFNDFILEGQAVVVEFIKQAQEAGRTKLIIDLSANGGGSVVLAQSIYRLLFPDGKFTGWDRFRANAALEASSKAEYSDLVTGLISPNNYYPVNVEGKPIDTGKEFFGPYTVKGQNVTTAFQTNKYVPWDPTVPAYINGFDPQGPIVAEALWKPEDILIVTDGICASACGIFTGLLTRNYNIRTLALGGRPLNQAMQAMGGVKGTEFSFNSDIVSAITQVQVGASGNQQASSILEDASASLPSFLDPPLLPMSKAGGHVNLLNGYTEDNLEGYPVQFRYEAANCRLFYTQIMLASATATWQRARGVAWNNEPCVPGSTTGANGVIGDKTLKYDPKVRSRASKMQGPGMLK